MYSEQVGKSEEKEPKYKFGLMPEVINLLPDYIDDDIKESLQITHQKLEVQFTDNFRENADYFIQTPRNVNKVDKKNYQSGIQILNEVATESLCLEMISNHIKRENYNHFHDLWATSIVDHLWNKNKDSPEGFVGLLQHIHVYMFTGDRTNVDDYIKEHIDGVNNIEDLAIMLGRTIPRNTEVSNENTYGEYYIGKFGKILINKNLILRAYDNLALTAITLGTAISLAKGSIDYGFPDLVWFRPYIMAFNSIVAAGLAIYKGKDLKNSLVGGLHIALHEVIHYLSHNPLQNRIGVINYYAKRSS